MGAAEPPRNPSKSDPMTEHLLNYSARPDKYKHSYLLSSWRGLGEEEDVKAGRIEEAEDKLNYAVPQLLLIFRAHHITSSVPED
ncbi:hypothetical protein F7725_015423 [Dissostichus mawsoni]|uniref:Uncharacterized protein n=1 Tax=Dissostichus mawsoni TaxID=36200 RepID=A0A7J5YHE4_DISMA|nr:hypothetical protein F7725_015423 [Dissostichus mawsoni]